MEELQELVENKIEALRIAKETKASFKDLQEFFKTKLTQKVKDLMILQESGSGVDEELMDDEFKDLRIYFDLEDIPKNTCSIFLEKVTSLTTFLLKIDPNNQLQFQFKRIEANKKWAMDLYQRFIEVELDCLKYNLPKLDNQIQEPGEYKIKMQKYMKTWEEEAKMYRQKGYKTFRELLQQTGQSSQDGRMTFEEVKLIVIDTATDLARLLVEFLFLVTRTTEELAILIDWIRTALECIIVDGNSIIIGTFLEVLELAVTQAMEEKLIIPSSSDEGNGSLYITHEECDMFRKILREYVRFEVCFFCPSLPFMYSNDVLRSMGELFRIHSEKKMNRIAYKIVELKKVEKPARGDVVDLKMNQFKLIFFSHIDKNRCR